MTTPRARLAAVYTATDYRATWPVVTADHAAPAAICLRVGQSSNELDRWLTGVGAREWAYLSAANPASRPLSAAGNAERTAQLGAELVRRGLPFLHGESVADDDDWPPEASFLVAALTENGAADLATRFGQYAFLCGEINGPARLCWTPLAP